MGRRPPALLRPLGCCVLPEAPPAQGGTSSPGWPGLTLHSRATVPSLSSLPLPLWGFHLFPLSLDPILLHGCHIAARSPSAVTGPHSLWRLQGKTGPSGPSRLWGCLHGLDAGHSPTSAPSSVPGGPHTFLRVCVSKPPHFKGLVHTGCSPQGRPPNLIKLEKPQPTRGHILRSWTQNPNPALVRGAARRTAGFCLRGRRVGSPSFWSLRPASCPGAACWRDRLFPRFSAGPPAIERPARDGLCADTPISTAALMADFAVRTQVFRDRPHQLNLGSIRETWGRLLKLHVTHIRLEF